MQDRRHEVRLALEMVRRHTKKRTRRRVWGSVNYTCECGASERVLVCAGVMVSSVFAVPAPRVITCFVCGEDALRLSPVEVLSVALHHPPSGVAYICVPSRRECARLVERARFEAQLVRPSESESPWLDNTASLPLADETLRQAV